MHARSIVRTLLVVVTFVAASPLASQAQVRQLGTSPRVIPQITRSEPIVRSAVVPNVHVRPGSGRQRNAVYGTIVAIAGTTLTIRTRADKLRHIDAGPAISAGTYSAPLFIGKLVVAEGLTRVDGVLTAARVSRLTRLANADPDR